MSKIENAVEFAIKIANDNSHGYDQGNRWGSPDYDCSALVITACEQAGIPLKTKGATYTGNIRKAALRCGFKDVTKDVRLKTGQGLKRGDILLSEGHHVAFYVGDYRMVDARINEKGKTTGGKHGDQTGKEIMVHNYSNHPWDCVLRYSTVKGAVAKLIKHTYGGAFPNLPSRGYFKKGDKGENVKKLQKFLLWAGYALPKYGADGDYEDETISAVNHFMRDCGFKKINGMFGKKSLAHAKKLKR